MKPLMKKILCALAIAALASFTVMAKDKKRVAKKVVRFSEDTMVNGTLVKAGEYEIKFDENTNELSILKNGKVKASTPVHLETRNDKAKDTMLLIRQSGQTAELRGVAFDGWNSNVVVGSGPMSGSQ